MLFKWKFLKNVSWTRPLVFGLSASGKHFKSCVEELVGSECNFSVEVKLKSTVFAIYNTILKRNNIRCQGYSWVWHYLDDLAHTAVHMEPTLNWECGTVLLDWKEKPKCINAISLYMNVLFTPRTKVHFTIRHWVQVFIFTTLPVVHNTEFNWLHYTLWQGRIVTGFPSVSVWAKVITWTSLPMNAVE